MASNTLISRFSDHYIVSARYDLMLFILAPVICLFIAVFLHSDFVRLNQQSFLIFGVKVLVLNIFIQTWIFAHIFAVFIRSHLNPTYFKMFPYRFTIVPAALFLLFYFSIYAAMIGFVVAVLWDIYHTSKQNFGFCRIYDGKKGNPPALGRGLDQWMNHLIYIGPIICTPGFEEHVALILPRLYELGLHVEDFIAYSFMVKDALKQVIYLVGPVFVFYYCYYYYQHYKAGAYSFPANKALFLVSAGVSCWLAWFQFPLIALFVMNFFHALQYFGIVWHYENDTLEKLFKLKRFKYNGLAVFLIFFVILLFSGSIFWYTYSSWSLFALCLITVGSLMHFWYDSFLWSVKGKQV